MSKRHIVFGAAGFIGSHLCDELLNRGDNVVGVDNFLTGSRLHIDKLQGHPHFEFVEADISLAGWPTSRLHGPIDSVLNFASPASPTDFLRLAPEILDVGSAGTRFGLELAREFGAKYLQASTSEVYGEAQVHPQREDYFGNVNSVGLRSDYDEAKRVGEAYCMAWHRGYGVDTRIMRIFNTYGPRMNIDDGRVFPTFIRQCMADLPITIYGDGDATRSFCYVSDLVAGALALLDAPAGLNGIHEPFNVGNPDEVSILEVAHEIANIVPDCSGRVKFLPARSGDPLTRRPDITRAVELLGWTPIVSRHEGLVETVRSFA